MSQFFRDGGWGMYPTLIFGVAALALAALFLARPGVARLEKVMARMESATFLAGSLGFLTGLHTTLTYVFGSEVPQEDRLRIFVAGLLESSNNLLLAIGLLVLSRLVSSAAMLRAP